MGCQLLLPRVTNPPPVSPTPWLPPALSPSTLVLPQHSARVSFWLRRTERHLCPCPCQRLGCILRPKGKHPAGNNETRDGRDVILAGLGSPH